MEVKHSLPFHFLELIIKEKKDGGYNSCYFLSLDGTMLTNGWRQKCLFGHEYFWPTVSRLIEQKMPGTTDIRYNLGQIIKQL